MTDWSLSSAPACAVAQIATAHQLRHGVALHSLQQHTNQGMWSLIHGPIKRMETVVQASMICHSPQRKAVVGSLKVVQGTQLSRVQSVEIGPPTLIARSALQGGFKCRLTWVGAQTATKDKGTGYYSKVI